MNVLVPTTPGPAGVVADEAPAEDALDLRLRLVQHLFGRIFKAEPAGVWYAPAPVLLLGGREGGPALAVPTRWGARVAASARDDAFLTVASVNRPVEPIFLDLDYRGKVEVPGWAADVQRIAQALLARAHRMNGGFILTYLDLPEQSGVAANVALHCAVARALTAVSAPDVPPLELLAALGVHGTAAAASTAAMFGRPGHAMLIPPGFSGSSPESPGPLHVAFDPAAAGMRLVILATRSDPEATVTPWEPDADEDDRVHAAFQTLSEGGGGDPGLLALAGLLTASHEASRGRRDPTDADLAVEAALSSGAAGARATSPTTAIALVPIPALRAMRAAVVEAFRSRGLRVPRFLSTGTSAEGPSTQRDSLLDV